MDKTKKKISSLTVAEFESILKEAVTEVVRKEYLDMKAQENREYQRGTRNGLGRNNKGFGFGRGVRRRNGNR